MNLSGWLFCWFHLRAILVLLKSGGIDIFYIDESHDRHFYVVSAICVPFLRNIEGNWTITWPTAFEAARLWRRAAKDNVNIPVTKELHGVDLLAGRGNFLKGKHNFRRPKAASVYRQLLENIDFLPDKSVMTVSASRTVSIYGNQRLEAAMYALFQRMRTRCQKAGVNAMTFFDQGHPEYRKLYRMAQRYLPTGSKLGGWDGKATKNLPLDMFFKDANEKNSFWRFVPTGFPQAHLPAPALNRAERGEFEPDVRIQALTPMKDASLVGHAAFRFGTQSTRPLYGLATLGHPSERGQ